VGRPTRPPIRVPIRGILEHFGFDLTNSKVRCVFHDDAHASGLWSETYYTCLACGVRGDAVGLLHDQEGLEWKDAFSRAEELAGAVHTDSKKGGSGLRGGPTLGKGRAGARPSFGSR
jgi:CHC2 zinc finger